MRWFEGLINKDIEVTNEVYSIQSVEFDRQVSGILPLQPWPQHELGIVFEHDKFLIKERLDSVGMNFVVSYKFLEWIWVGRLEEVSTVCTMLKHGRYRLVCGSWRTIMCYTNVFLNLWHYFLNPTRFSFNASKSIILYQVKLSIKAIWLIIVGPWDCSFCSPFLMLAYLNRSCVNSYGKFTQLKTDGLLLRKTREE